MKTSSALKNKYSLEDCKKIFARTSDCIGPHLYKKWIRPYKCDTSIETCEVCAKTFGKIYH